MAKDIYCVARGRYRDHLVEREALAASSTHLRALCGRALSRVLLEEEVLPRTHYDLCQVCAQAEKGSR